MAAPDTILFLCTGNYYRSRFAEIYFNHLNAAGNRFRADSRGLRVSPESGNVGPISPFALEGLFARGINVIELRNPCQVTEQDLKLAFLVVALYEEEHRPYIMNLYPDWDTRVEYWNVPDLGEMDGIDALGSIEKNIHLLMRRLTGQEQINACILAQ